ncbi:MAG TPA: malectin domain-containing carbohydrate-binding protein, partial [Polyangiaceae bacterium]|nr:malectin domain-containing carbohydrate-binding protein [Polyangiaceae bacterium]
GGPFVVTATSGSSSATANVTIGTAGTGSAIHRLNVGAGATGSFVADKYFTGGSTYSAGGAVSTAGVANAAPAALYQSERYGNFSYAMPNLSAGGSYTVRLHFAEIYYNAANSRVFHVDINGTRVLQNFDIYVAAGGTLKALVKDFPAVANASGQVTVTFTSVTDSAKLSGIEVLSAGGQSGGSNAAPTVANPAAVNPTTVTGTTANVSVLGADDAGEAALVYTWSTSGTPPAPVSFGSNASNAAKNSVATFSASGNYTLLATITDAAGATVTSSVPVVVTIPASGPPGPVYQINAGDGAAAPFTADQYGSGGNTYFGGTGVNVAGVQNAAPASVYQTERYGNSTYTFGSLTVGAQYTVRLHFAELYWTTANSRLFNVTVNGAPALTNFDIFAAAGTHNKAVVRDVVATATSGGQLVIAFVTVKDNAKVSGIEIIR